VKTQYVMRHGKRIAVEVETLEIKPAKTKPATYVQITWAQVERLRDAARSGTTTRVFHLLLFRSFRSRGESFKLSADAFSNDGVSRTTQWRALCELRRLGLITADRDGNRTRVQVL
jgi:hypothetical protein